MKHLKFFILVIGALGLASCSDAVNEDENLKVDQNTGAEEGGADAYGTSEEIANAEGGLVDGEYEVEGELVWVGKKVLGEHTGTIQLKEGSLAVEGGEITEGEFIIDMTTINTTDLSGGQKEELDNHLFSDDFFSVEAYPEATFEITEVINSSADNYEVNGMLSVKETTAPVTVAAKISQNGDELLASGDASVDRTIYDVRFGSDKFTDNLGDGVIDDFFEVSVELKATK